MPNRQSISSIAAALVFAVSLGVFGATTNQAGAEHTKPLIMAISNWPPYKGETLPGGGIVTDIAVQALKRAGFEISTIVVPWKRAYAGTVVGKYDVLPAVWLNPERAKELEFGASVVTSRVVIVSRKEANFEYRSLDDLRGQKVGVAAGWGYPKAFQEADFFTKETSANLTQSLRKLVYGRINLAIVEEVAARYTVSTEFKDAAPNLRYSKVALQENDLHVAFSRKHPDSKEIRKRFDAAVAAMRTDGSLMKILDSHGVMPDQN